MQTVLILDGTELQRLDVPHPPGIGERFRLDGASYLVESRTWNWTRERGVWVDLKLTKLGSN